MEGDYISIIKTDENNWYKFDGSKVEKFDDKFFLKEYEIDADFLVYELSKKKPIKTTLNEYECNQLMKLTGLKVQQVEEENDKEIKKEYYASNLKKKEFLEKIFNNINKKEYYQYIPIDHHYTIINIEYFLEVLRDNKTYDNLYEKIINFDNNLIKMLIEII